MYIKESLDATAEYVTRGMSASQHKQRLLSIFKQQAFQTRPTTSLVTKSVR